MICKVLSIIEKSSCMPTIPLFFLLERTFRNIWKLDNTNHMSFTMANQWQIYVSFCLTTGYHIWRSFRGLQTIAHYVRSLFTTRSFFHFAKTVFVWFQSLVSWKKLCVLGNVFWSPVTMLSKQHFDFTTQSDTTQLTQSHHNCVDTWACRTASATMPVYSAHDMHTNSAQG